MAAKKPTNQELEDMFAGIGDDESSSTPKDAKDKADASTAPPAAKSAPAEAEDDPLAELRNLANRPAPTSRSSTPHVSTISSSAASVRKNTPPSSRSGRSSEEKATTSDQKVLASDPQQDSSQPAAAAAAAAASSWWGGISSLASAAVKQAKGAVEEIQKNEEALKWAEQMRGNYGTLRGLGDDLRSRALPTFTTLLHTLAPPISQHERLQIHIAHDIVGYPSLDPLIYATFSRVMAQVEGGELLVIQRGSESAQRRTSDAAYTGSGGSSWTDGPWWRAADGQRSINAVPGLVEGSKLARANAEAYSNEYYTARGGVEEAAKQATASMSETNPVRSSDIFVAIQPISHTVQSELFSGKPTKTQESAGDDKIVTDASAKPDELLSFAIYLHDPVHSINFGAMTQAFPHQWTKWMDASSSVSVHDGTQFVPQLPEEIADIVNSGGVDPREWVAEWMEEILSLGVGIIAQRYVARRMGVGAAGGLGRGRRRDEAVDNGGGEAARAV